MNAPLQIAVLCLILLLSTTGYSQNRVDLPQQYRNAYIEQVQGASLNLKGSTSGLQNSTFFESLGESLWDLQSRSTSRQRMAVYVESSMAAVWTTGSDAPGFTDLGIGYSHKTLNGNWTPPEEPLFGGYRVAEPSIASWGTEGEIVSAHSEDETVSGIIFNRREQNGSGVWAESFLQGPQGHEDIKWAHMITSGENNEIIHVLALTPPESFGGSPYSGQDGAILYSRSNDGGESWEIENLAFDQLGSEYYPGFSPDTYSWVESDGESIAFIVSDEWHDLVLMRSNDQGNSWEKTIIWEHPYPGWDGEETQAFYCPDGTFSGTLLEEGKVHLTFGISKVKSNGNGEIFQYPFNDGIGYWNEDRPVFSNKLNALNPYGHQDSELYTNYNLVGWVPDINGNGEWVSDLVCDEPQCIGTYYQGAASMPLLRQLGDIMVLIYSAVCEVQQTSEQNYRQLFIRFSKYGNGWSELEWFTESPSFTFSECVFPAIAADYPAIISFQDDNEPGLALMGDEDPFSTNEFNTLPFEMDIPYVFPPEGFTSSVDENDVYLEWNEHVNPSVSGYNVYRDGEKLNDEVLTATNFQDLDAPEGTYLYGVTAVVIDSETYASNALVEVGTEGLDEVDGEGVKVYPNPAESYITIQSSAKMNEIRLMNSIGKTLYGSSVYDFQSRLNISEMNPGVYILEIGISDEVIIKKIIIE
ncbi:MAG: T9SS type A sorting domain-containing protein [Bacteroidales bacterium]|nr:T9SS type A sorting domain-containing protein [Bacteroidales bacterium]